MERKDHVTRLRPLIPKAVSNLASAEHLKCIFGGDCHDDFVTDDVPDLINIRERVRDTQGLSHLID